MKLVHLACGRGDDPQTSAARKRLHRYPQQRRVRDRVMARINRASGPGKRAEDEDDGAERIDAFRTAKVRRANEQCNAREAEDKADENARGGPDTAWAQPV